jgi:4-hydroxybenzoate polyprenyltransferase
MPATLRDWGSSLRPKHWLKNTFVLAPVLFAEHYKDPVELLLSAGAFACFCGLSSGMYLLNDVLDRANDVRHPRKKTRPIAAGRISPGVAVAVALTLILVVMAIAVAVFPWAFAFFAAAYVVNTLAYILWLKHKVILDVLLIAVGFVLRLLAGCAAIAVEPTNWLLVCGFSLALVLGFGKRRTEIASAGVSLQFRPALQSYDAAKLDAILGTCTAVCLVSYMLFTVAPETITRHGTDHLMYTVPIVAYGLFRYLFKVMEGSGDGPTDILVADPVFACTGAIWGAAVALILVLK